MKRANAENLLIPGIPKNLKFGALKILEEHNSIFTKLKNVIKPDDNLRENSVYGKNAFCLDPKTRYIALPVKSSKIFSSSEYVEDSAEELKKHK